MKKKPEYVVRFSELKEDTETYEFLLNGSFFESFSSNEWESGRIRAIVEIKKRTDGITLGIQMNGELMVVCDRCLELFPLQVDIFQQLFVKYGEGRAELDDDVVVVAKDENQIDLSGFFYDYLVVSIPVRRVHPDNKNGESGCSREMIEKLNEHIITKNAEKFDPRWDELKKLMDKN
ncbi:MAG: DUF177 domain-containing protein [Bacteroidales bacterium]|nr:DUF177 domain-containing protein [Bacteroidales bacterium]